eukprot:scaffold24896_cov37-Prasinocladus_malaysianus.AAC.1
MFERGFGPHLEFSQPGRHSVCFLPPYDGIQVSFDKIRVSRLAQFVVMQVVVLDIPCLRQHPVQPICHPFLGA